MSGVSETEYPRRQMLSIRSSCAIPVKSTFVHYDEIGGDSTDSTSQSAPAVMHKSASDMLVGIFDISDTADASVQTEASTFVPLKAVGENGAMLAPAAGDNEAELIAII